MIAVSLSHWFAALSLGLSISAAGAVPVVAWVDADYLLVDDWQAVGDRLLVEIVRARHTLRAVPVTAAALLMLLTASPEVAS